MQEKLSYISLGELRQRFSPQHQPLPPSWAEEVRNFKRHTSHDNASPLFIYGSDGGLPALRIRSKQPELVGLQAAYNKNYISRFMLKRLDILKGTVQAKFWVVNPRETDQS